MKEKERLEELSKELANVVKSKSDLADRFGQLMKLTI